MGGPMTLDFSGAAHLAISQTPNVVVVHHSVRPYPDFTVLPPDPHRFDRDKDGVGCER